MTVTGLTKVLEDISDAIYEDLLKILTLLRSLHNPHYHLAPSLTQGCGDHRHSDCDGTCSDVWFIGPDGHYLDADDRSDVPHPHRVRC